MQGIFCLFWKLDINMLMHVSTGRWFAKRENQAFKSVVSESDVMVSIDEDWKCCALWNKVFYNHFSLL